MKAAVNLQQMIQTRRRDRIIIKDIKRNGPQHIKLRPQLTTKPTNQHTGEENLTTCTSNQSRTALRTGPTSRTQNKSNTRGRFRSSRPKESHPE